MQAARKLWRISCQCAAAIALQYLSLIKQPKPTACMRRVHFLFFNFLCSMSKHGRATGSVGADEW